MVRSIANWLESHWVLPSYSGWLMLGLAIFFFGAATNTMAGWLYVISGVMFALLAIAAVLPGRSLRHLHIVRRTVGAVSVGDLLTVEIAIENPTAQPKLLVQISDRLPPELGSVAKAAIEIIPARDTYVWFYQRPAQQRGVYRWDQVQMQTATPLGLFWTRRDLGAKAKAVVYPTVLPLVRCPLVDELGQDSNTRVQSAAAAQGATEGVTRTLRPYRWGDSIRLIHWRTSARFGELRVRELEVFTGGQQLVIALDSANRWQPDGFEQAVSAAASLYFYAIHHRLQVSLWTAATGQLRGDRSVLEALAATQRGEAATASHLPDLPLVWLTQTPDTLQGLPPGSRWLLWSDSEAGDRPVSRNSGYPGLCIQPDQTLQVQLQSSLSP